MERNYEIYIENAYSILSYKGPRLYLGTYEYLFTYKSRKYNIVICDYYYCDNLLNTLFCFRI